MLDGDARTYRPLPPAVFDRWREAANQGILRADALLRLVANLRHADGTPLDPEVLRRAANAWEETLESGVPPAHLVVCPNWQCEMPVSEETLFSEGCPRCGTLPRPMIRFPALSESIQELLERFVCRPGDRLDSALHKVEQLHVLAPQEGGVVAPWTDGRLPSTDRTELARHQADALKHANRVTVAIAGDKNRGKSTIGNLLVGLADARTGDHREAFPALHVVNTQVTKEVLLPGGRFLDLPGVNSLYEQHDQEAQRRIDDADAVVLVVNAKSPLMEPEFRFVRDHVVRPSLSSSTVSGGLGNRRLVVALAKIDVLARDREERRREIDQATHYVLQGADGNEGLATLLPERSIRVVPVSAKWYGFHDLDGVRHRAEQAIKGLRIEAPTAPVRPVRVHREGIRIVAKVSPGTEVDTGLSALEAAREAVGLVVGAPTFPQVRRAIEAIPIPELPARSTVPDARASLGGPVLGVFLGVFAASMLAWLAGVPPVPAFGAALAVGLAVFHVLVRRLAARIEAGMCQRIVTADAVWSRAFRETSAKYVRSVVEEGLRALRDVPERLESGIPELVRAIEETVSSNALTMKVVEPGQSVRKRCRDWGERLKVAGRLMDVAITRGEKQVQEMVLHQQRAVEAAESGVSASLNDLAARMSCEVDEIVDHEISGFFNGIRMLWSKEDSRPIQNLQRRVGAEVANQGRVEHWVRTDTLNRVQAGVSSVVDRLQGALEDGSAVMSREIKGIALNPNLSTGELWKGGGMMGGGLAVAIVGLCGAAAIKGAIAGSVAGPWGTAAGALAGIIVALVSMLVGKFLGGKGANAMAEVRNTIKQQMRGRLRDAMVEQVQPALVQAAAKAIEGPFREMRENAVRALVPVREDRATVTAILSELAEIDHAVRSAAPMEVRHEFA